MTNQAFDSARDSIERSVRSHWKLLLIEGVLLVVFGLLAMAVPLLAGIAVTLLFGWLLLFSGIAGMITTLAMRHAAGFWWSLLSAALGMLVGVSLLAQPGLGLVTLTYFLVAFFIVEGVATIMFALDHRRTLSGRWGWMLVSGVVDLFLAAMILMGFPGSTAWALGLVVGVNMLFGGASLIAMSLAARSQMP